MKQVIAVISMFLFYACQLNGQAAEKAPRELFPIIENGLWGYIDSKGKEVITPQFLSGGQFSEGLCPVRLNGTYGYINEQGDFVIQAKYDMAYSFEKGQAKVYIDAKPYYIDKEGMIMFEHNFAEIKGFNENDISIAITKTEKYGVINRKGELLADTIYKRIEPFTDGRAIITGMNHLAYPEKGAEPNFQIGVIDTEGNIIIPFGQYKSILNFSNGFAKVNFLDEDLNENQDEQGIIDKTGQLKFIIPEGDWYFDYGNEDISNGLGVVEIYFTDSVNLKVEYPYNRDKYRGVVNTDGEIVFSNENWEEITPFHKSRAFVQDRNENWFLINNKGEILNAEPYTELIYDSWGNAQTIFESEIQFVKIAKDSVGAIDIDGNFIVASKHINEYYNFYPRGNTLFFQDEVEKEDDYIMLYGFWNTATDVFVDLKFNDINMSSFTEDLIYVEKDKVMAYADQNGKILWKANQKDEKLSTTLNIDYMNRGYFYASSPYKKELAGAGGWGGSGNDFKKMKVKNDFEANKLSVLVKTYQSETSKEITDSIKLFVANTKIDTSFLDAQDSRLYITIQAKDKFGEWKNIEYLPSSWCGNSYHTLFLPQNHFWEFKIPVYEGDFNTTFRAKLIVESNWEEEDVIIYSNEYDGSVNPGQFWRKLDYYSSGLMDPYND